MFLLIGMTTNNVELSAPANFSLSIRYMRAHNLHIVIIHHC